MSLAKLAAGACAAVALCAASPGADAKGKGGGRGIGGGHHGQHGHAHTAASPGSPHHHGGHGFAYTSVFVGTSFLLWPSAYDWPAYHPGAPAADYWYYCEPYAAYYPDVQECPTDWQPVLPASPFPGS